MSVGEAFNKIVAEALRHLSTSHQPVQEGSPQGVHQARVSIRRIRAALRAFKKSLPYDKRKAFNGEFRWFQARLAPARDWHVFLSETVPSIQESRPRSRVSLANLARGAATERRRATAEARELFKSRRFTRLVLEFQRWVLALELEKGAMFDLELKPFAQGVLDKTRRDFLLDIRPLSRMSEEDRHSLRKRGKKARYATEFFAGLWQGRQVDNYLQLMEKIQDLLGEANDAVVARQVLATLPPRLLKPSTIWRVQQWSEQRVRHNIKVGQPLWRRVKTAEPFWV
jgi:CHAD domain-containing protein